MAISRRYSTTAARGFTLVELVVGMVVMSIALTYLTSVFFASPQRSVEPMLQARASGFAQALLDEILAKPFDELTPLGGVPACNPCSVPAALGADAGETRTSFDDVDDYHSYCGASPVALVDAFGNTPAEFASFGMTICVGYDGDYDGLLNETGVSESAKLIEVALYPPATSEPLVFRAYRGNF